MMTRRQRLMATLRGEPVDRPAVSFYEIGGFSIDPGDPDPFNVYNDPSWRGLLELAEERTDIIRMVCPASRPTAPDLRGCLFADKTWTQGSARFTRTTLTVAGRTLTSLTRRDAEVNTVWTLEHLLKDEDDLQAYLQLPDEVFHEQPDASNLFAAERRLGERGVVMVDTGDPLCRAASLFSMEDFTILAFTKPELFHALLAKIAPPLLARTQAVARDFPGRLWRIYGPEYASEPYLPPRLFDEYVVRYTGPMVTAIARHGGFARVHCHGRVRNILPKLVAMGAAATDPIEPPPLGDISLAEARHRFGRDLVLFGNLEIADIENMPSARFERVVAASLRDGTAGEGRGFVLMPSAAPYGRSITPLTLTNYQTMVHLAESA
jgi:uroporphyrinogen-III decarboxylase